MVLGNSCEMVTGNVSSKEKLLLIMLLYHSNGKVTNPGEETLGEIWAGDNTWFIKNWYHGEWWLFSCSGKTSWPEQHVARGDSFGIMVTEGYSSWWCSRSSRWQAWLMKQELRTHVSNQSRQAERAPWEWQTVFKPQNCPLATHFLQ